MAFEELKDRKIGSFEIAWWEDRLAVFMNLLSVKIYIFPKSEMDLGLH